MPKGAREGPCAATEIQGRAFCRPSAPAGDAQDQRAIRVPADSHLPWRKPCGRASRVQMRSGHICLWARKDKLAGSDHSAGSGMGRTTFARRAASRTGGCHWTAEGWPEGQTPWACLGAPEASGCPGKDTQDLWAQPHKGFAQVTRRRGETRVKFTRCRRPLPFRASISDENALSAQSIDIRECFGWRYPSAVDRNQVEPKPRIRA